MIIIFLKIFFSRVEGHCRERKHISKSIESNRIESTMVLDGDATFNGNGAINDGMISETALDWFHRSQRQSGRSGSGNKKRRRRNGSAAAASSSSSWNDGFDGDDGDESSDHSDLNTATDPSMAAWRFLRFGKSGIAPIDAAWKRSRDGTGTSASKQHRREQSQRGRPRPRLVLPPVTVLEGPKDVGKTWMLLTLAARFVVATRASRFKDFDNKCDKGKSKGIDAIDKMQTEGPNSGSDTDDDDDDEEDDDSSITSSRNNDDRPKVLLLDSTYDFSVSQLVNVVRLTLERERHRQRVRKSNQSQRERERECQPQVQAQQQQQQQQQQDVTNNDGMSKNGGRRGDKQHQERNIEEELERQEREKMSLEQDMEDCLRRIHIIQVDNGSTGWVPMLEALKYQLSEDRRRRNTTTINSVRPRNAETSPVGPPTLLLWDGFLSDMALSSNATTTPKASAVLGDSLGSFSNVQALFDSPGAQELLRQLSRLLQKERDALWLVLTTRTVSGTTAAAATNDTPSEHSGIGLRLTEWIRKEEERRGDKDSGLRQPPLQNRYPNQQQKQKQQQPHRASYRIRLDRRQNSRTTGTVSTASSTSRGEGRVPSTAAAAAALFAKVLVTTSTSTAANFDSSGVGTNGAGNRSSSSVVAIDGNDDKIPYSISLGGILS